MSPSSPPSAAILGCAGDRLTDDERAFFRNANPFGLILFARNIGAPEAVARLITDFRDAVGRADAPVLLDQEGGRVARLRPPHWPALPAAGQIGALWPRNPDQALRAADLLGQAIAATLAPLGFDVACAPDCDVAAPGADAQVIGDRSYGADPDVVAALAAQTEAALRAAGMATTPKHAPGHGRATVDSHHDLPRVDASLDALLADLAPFRATAAAPFFMTAHIVFDALDPERPATCSSACLDWLRRETGFAGAILSDDLAMNALEGAVADRARAAMAAGCDGVLYCPGDMAGNVEAVAAAGPAGEPLLGPWRAWTQARPASIQADAFALAAELWALVEDA